MNADDGFSGIGMIKVNPTRPGGPLKIYKLRIFEYFQNETFLASLARGLNRRMTFEFELLPARIIRAIDVGRSSQRLL